MKKTIITLLALAGVAVCAESLSPTLVWDMDFLTTGVDLKCANGVTTNLGTGVGTNLIEDGAITLSNDKFSFTQTAGRVSYADEFTLLAKVSLSSTQGNNHPVIFSMGEDNKWYWKAAYYTQSKAFNLDKDGFDSVDESKKNSGAIAYTAGSIITLALQSDGKGKLTLFVDGEMAGYTTITKASDYGSDKLVNNFTFGGRNGSDDNKANVTIYDAQLVRGLTTQLIPEPTTATLSLLALAGLVTRRRRK
ncbi:MAG: LamG domain-containing protein [Akkermansiaceae bacterium]|nr:LamG domain-containing protein [Akkermansiaceae bacterium]